MKHTNFGYLLKEGFRALFKHGFMSFAAVCITVACLVIVCSFGLIAYNISLTAEEIQKENRITVCIDENFTQAQAKNVGSQINLIENVAEARFISRQEALENYIGDSDASIFEGLSSESMRDQFEITLVDNGKLEETLTALEEVPGVADVYADRGFASAMATFRNVLYVATAGITGVLLLVSILIISNTIKLAMLDRREEIAIMRMVGATNSFIRFPFLVEGFLLGLLATLFSFGIVWGMYEVIRGAMAGTELTFITIIPFTDVLLPMVAVCAGTGFFIGIFGSMMSIRRFLKV